MPTPLVVAGPKGCGKSTLTRMSGFRGLEIIDPDAIVRGITAGDALLEPSVRFQPASLSRASILTRAKASVVPLTPPSTD